MTSEEKVIELRQIIDRQLRSLIDNDYVYLDLPYHPNIGDTLIWEGTRSFLKTIPYKCLYSTSCNEFHYKVLSSNIIILLHGGGNFGDLYRKHSNFRKKIIELYPENRIIILPQTAYYENKSLLRDDITFYSKHSNVIICARERYSYNLLKENFKNKVLLLPDMAFFIDLHFSDNKKCNKALYLRRMDKEYVENNISLIPKDVDTHDWPTYERFIFSLFTLDKLLALLRHTIKIFSPRIFSTISDNFRLYFYRPIYIHIGISFLQKYSTIYTTRLHVLILGFLLKKNIYIMNNSSGKVLNFYNTWLSDINNIHLL